MSSILKVDQLQDSGGNSIITSDGAGNITPGSLNIANAQIASNAAIATTKLGTGAVLQIQYHVRTNTITVSAGNTTTVQSVSITPTSTSSKILLHVKYNGYSYNGSSDLNYGEKFLRDSTVIKNNGEMWYKASTTNEFVNSSATWIDEPNSTSSITYNYQIVTYSNRGNFEYGRGGANTTFYAMEIAG